MTTLLSVLMPAVYVFVAYAVKGLVSIQGNVGAGTPMCRCWGILVGSLVPPTEAPETVMEPLGLTMLTSPLTALPPITTGVALIMSALRTLPLVGSVAPWM